MNRDQAIALIRGSGLADRLDRILPHLVPGLRIRATRAPATDRALVSRFAGQGVLPRGTSWPTWDSSALHRRWIEYSRAAMAKNKGSSTTFWNAEIERYEALIRDNPKPLAFLAMVRLADVAPHAALLGLPDDGALLFFYDVERSQGSFWPEARGGWQVVHVRDETELAVVDEPRAQRSDFVPCTLAFEMHYSLPASLRDATGDDDLHVFKSPDYDRVHRALLGGAATEETIHQLGGAPQEVQHGLFHQCQLASNGVDCGSPEDPAAPLLAAGAKDWRLILQIDTDEPGPGWMWGDTGRLYFCAHRDDLAAERFDRTWCVEQCY